MDAAKLVAAVVLVAWVGPAPSRKPIPFSLLAEHLVVVKGEIDGAPDLNLVVDTGTARTVIDTRLAKRLALSMKKDAAEVFGATVNSHRVTIESVAFGTVRAVGLEVLVADLRAQEHRFGVRIDALVGVDVLRSACLTIDYASRRLEAGCKGALPLTTSFTSSLPIVEVVIDGRPYRLIADTGSDAIAIFRTSIPADARVVSEGSVTAGHLTGKMELTRFTPKQVLVGGHSIGMPPVFIIDTDGHSLGYDGVLGTRWLTASQLRFDLAKGVMSWVGLSRARYFFPKQ